MQNCTNVLWEQHCICNSYFGPAVTRINRLSKRRGQSLGSYKLNQAPKFHWKYFSREILCKVHLWMCELTSKLTGASRW